MYINANIIGRYIPSGLASLDEYIAYREMVEADGGTIDNPAKFKLLLKYLVENELLADTDLCVALIGGLKVRTDGVQDFITKLYDLSANLNHPVQATEVDQLMKAGDIVPGGLAKALNPNREDNFLTHTQIDYSDSAAWTAIFVLNWNFSPETFTILEYGGGKYLEFDNQNFRFRTVNSGGNTVGSSGKLKHFIGKNRIMPVVGDGAGNIKFYLDGILHDTLTVASDMTFLSLFSTAVTNTFNGALYYLHIYGGNLTPIISSYSDLLRSIFPEIESVVIGSQEWATSNLDIACTPEGNVISEVQLATDTELLTDDGTFESYADTAAMAAAIPMGNDDETATWTLNTSSPISGSKDGLLDVTIAGTNSVRPIITFGGNTRSTGSWYKHTFQYKVNSGTCLLKYIYVNGTGAQIINETLSGSGTFTFYSKATGSGSIFALYFDGTSTFQIQLDNVSCKKVGWAGLGDLYDWLVDPAGGNYSVHDALKEAAAWCYYNNDPANFIYGKLYNWYAASLIDTDMGTASYGWHVPTEAEFNALVTALGGSTVAGGKLKQIGTDYWNSPNTGADNSSGFTLLPGGYREWSNGIFSLINRNGYMASISVSGSNNYRLYTKYDDDNTVIDANNKLRGYSIRLIKD